MIVKCPDCQGETSIDEPVIPGGGYTARCAVCGHPLMLGAPAEAGETTVPECGASRASGVEPAQCGAAFGKVRNDTDASLPPGASQNDVSREANQFPASIRTGVAEAVPTGRGDGADFSIGSAVRFGWAMAREHLTFYIGFMIAGGILVFLPGYMAGMADRHAPVITRFLFHAVATVLEAAVTMGFIRASLRVTDGDKPQLSNLLDCIPLFLKYFFSTLLYFLIILGGLLLLVVPGIIWSIKFSFYGYFIVDQAQGPLKALKSSARITAGAKMKIFLLGLALLAINALGALALVVGLFVTVPLSMVAFAYAFRKLEAPREV